MVIRRKNDKKAWHEYEMKQLQRLFSEEDNETSETFVEACRSLVESSGDSIYLVDKDCRYILMNKSHLKRLKLSLGDVIGRAYGDFHTKNQGKEFRKKVDEVFNTGKPVLHEHRSSRDRRYFLRTFSPMRNPSGEKIIGVTVISKDITERKRIEDELREKAVIAQTFMDALPCVALLLKTKTREIVALNQAAREAGARVGATCFESWPKLAKACWFCRAPETWETGRAQMLEVEALDIIWEAHWVPVTEELYLHYALDITDRKRAEEALKKSEELYRSLFDNMLNGFAYCRMVFDDQGRPCDFAYLAVNGAFETLTGLKDVVGKKVSEVIPGIRTADPELFDLYGRVAKGGRPERFERFVESLQMWFWVSVYSPEPGYFVAVFDVITERKRAEEALKESEKKFREIFESITDVFYRTDNEGILQLVSPSIEGLLGYVPDEVVGKRPADFYFNHEDRNRLHTLLKEKGEVREFEAPLKAKDGSVVWMSTNTQFRRNERGHVIGVQGTARDITKRKQAEKELEASRDLLVRSEKLAAVGQLSAGVAHEILNPINIMGMKLQMMAMNETLSEKVKDGFKTCQDQINRVTKICRDLNQFARVSEKKVSPVNLRELIDQVFSLIGPRLKIENVKPDVRHQPDLPLIPLDKDRMGQVILNLINNAVDAMKDKPDKKLVVTTEMAVKNHVRLSFSDTGTGIAPELLHKIFDPFYTTKEPEKGTGLGLSISYGIVQDHGGRIWAENNEWGGASFVIEFPVWESKTA